MKGTPFRVARGNFLRSRLAVALLGAELVFGTLGYMYLEGYQFIEGLYMTIITISTVGFTEVRPLSEAGRLFTSALIMLNVGIFAYLLAAFSYYVIEGNIFQILYRNRMQKAIDQLTDHVILCGFGKYGREIAANLKMHRTPYVIIEKEESIFEDLETEGQHRHILEGDATRDEVLLAAGIDRALGMITALKDDSDNLFIVLSARQLNPRLRIISRAMEPRSEKKLLMAGANHVILPDQIGGFYMATLINKPSAVEFFSFITNEFHRDVGFEEFRYHDLPEELRGRAIRDMHLRRDSGVNIIGYRNQVGDYIVNPSPETVLQEGDSFIVLGSDVQLRAMRQLLGMS
jgi:voltage-gated potassium channel